MFTHILEKYGEFQYHRKELKCQQQQEWLAIKVRKRKAVARRNESSHQE
jgi:hypothetical protein